MISFESVESLSWGYALMREGGYDLDGGCVCIYMYL